MNNITENKLLIRLLLENAQLIKKYRNIPMKNISSNKLEQDIFPILNNYIEDKIQEEDVIKKIQPLYKNEGWKTQFYKYGKMISTAAGLTSLALFGAYAFNLFPALMSGPFMSSLRMLSFGGSLGTMMMKTRGAKLNQPFSYLFKKLLTSENLTKEQKNHKMKFILGLFHGEKNYNKLLQRHGSVDRIPTIQTTVF